MSDIRERLNAALGDRYVVEAEIGRGGMATVYLAEDVAHDRKVALKVLHPEIAASLGPERFLREIKIAANLEHPYIVPLFASGEADGLLYYVMPYVEGETLQDRLTREGQLPVDLAIRIVSDVADGLEYAHEQGVIHRDIKPANILLSAGHARVADFGVARAIDAASEHQMTVTGLAMGTPKYMSPEQAAGEGETDRRSDVYSLACVLWESLAGQAPFDGPSAQAILARKISDEPPDLQAIRKTVDPALATTLEKGMALSPVDRFPTAKAFSEALADPGSVSLSRRRRGFTGWGSAAKVAASLAIAALLTVAGAWLTSYFQAGADSAAASSGEIALEPNKLAVAPFRVFSADEDWSEGVVDYLSRSLDHVGQLRTVPPSRAVQAWSGANDVAGANELGAATGAGLVVFGTLWGQGEDSVRVDATIVDVVAGQAIGDVEVRGLTERLDHVVDSLAVEVLRQLRAVRTIGAVEYTSIGSRSMPALKAFLQGEQAFRRTAWDSSIVLFTRAVELDSTFAMAHARLGLSLYLRMTSGEDSQEHWRKAGQYNQGLSRHDSLLVTVGAALFAGYGMDSMPPENRDYYIRDVAEQAVTEYMDDPEAWTFLGAVRTIKGKWIDATPEMKLDAWRKAIEADSSYALAYYYGFREAFEHDSVDLALSWARKFLSTSPPDWSRATPLLIDRLLDPVVTEAEANRLMDSVPQWDLFKTWQRMHLMTDEDEVAIQIARRATELPDVTEYHVTSQFVKRRNLAVSLAFRGHLEEAAEYTGTADVGMSWLPKMLPELAMMNAFPEATLDSTFAAWIRDEGSMGFAVWWWAVRGDTASVEAILDHSENKPGDFRAALALARADTAAFLTIMDDWVPSQWADQNSVIIHARVLSAQGRDDEAYDVLLQEFSDSWPEPSRVVWTMERARLAEKLGHTDQAIRDYRYVARAWVHADEELQPVVREAQEAILRLAG